MSRPTSYSSYLLFFPQVEKEVAIKMYTNMVRLQIMDTIFYEAQRQGRISFYLTTIGEEAINVASAAALSFDDIVFAQVDIMVLRMVTVRFFFCIHISNCIFFFPLLMCLQSFCSMSI